jgi:MFS family permease
MSTEATFANSAVSTQEGRRWWLFTACVLVSLTNEVSTAVTNLSMSPMRRDLGASSTVMQIAVTLGKLMLGAFMLAGGVAGDVYGRRHVLVLGALGMVGGSLLAAVAQTGGMLLVARALDGLASAAIAPLALALIASAFSQAEQAQFIGLFLGLSGLGAALGPLGAGLVVQAQGWRAGSLMPVAIAASRRISSRPTRSGKPTQWRRTTHLKDGRRTVGSTSRWPATAHNQLAHCFVCLRVACQQTSKVVPFATVQVKSHSCIL